jgi:amidase
MPESFRLVETTIDEIHEAMRAGTLSSEALVQRYLERIEAYDANGPGINSIVTVNAGAPERAAELDETLTSEGMVGPLHGIPTLVKDQAETRGLRTTFGSETCRDYVPDTDATIVRRLKDAGAVILAKTTMPDWAGTYFTVSSMTGQTRNPYDLERDPGGSSGGTGAGVAANLGTVGIGEDTAGSICIPAASTNLFGIRVTPGLISRTGLSPLVPRQDTPGPMARTVTDMTYLLDVLVGYDADDKWTGAVTQASVDNYVDYLNEDGLQDARIGVLRDRFGNGNDPRAAPVNEAVEDTLETLAEAGAHLVDPVSIPDLDERIGGTRIYSYSGAIYLDSFLAKREDIPYDSLRALYEADAYHESVPLVEAIGELTGDPRDELDYWRRSLGQESLRRVILHTFARMNIDALAFPDVQVVPPKISDIGDRYTDENFPINTTVAAQSQCPAISIPAELTAEGLPVGVELLGKPYHEHRLVEFAYAYERRADTRRPPDTAPGISED